MLSGEPSKRTIELEELPSRRGIRRSHEGGGYVLDVDRRGLTRLAPHRVDILMVHNGEKPGAEVCSGLPQMKLI